MLDGFIYLWVKLSLLIPLKSMHDLKLPLQEKALSPRGISGSGGWDARGGRGNGEWIAASAGNKVSLAGRLLSLQ